MIQKDWNIDEKLEFWTLIMQEKAASGLSVKEYCLQNDLKASTYYYWQRKVRQMTDAQPEVEQGDSDRNDPAPEASVLDNPAAETTAQDSRKTDRSASSASTFKPRGSQSSRQQPADLHRKNDIVIFNGRQRYSDPVPEKKDRFSDVPVTIHAGRLKILISQNASPALISLVVGALVC